MDFDILPYRVRYVFDMPADPDINENTPAKYIITPNTNGGFSLTVWLWEGIPDDFKYVPFYHELKQAEFEFVKHFSKIEAHEKAIPYHMAYAKKFLSKDKFTEFLNWQAKLTEYKGRTFAFE